MPNLLHLVYNVAVAANQTINVTPEPSVQTSCKAVIKCYCMAVPLCEERTSTPIVGHPADRVTVSVITATTQHLLLCTNTVRGEGGGSSERDSENSRRLDEHR